MEPGVLSTPGGSKEVKTGMKKVFTLALAVLLVFAFTGLGMASPSVAEKAKIKGTIVAVDKDAGTVTVKSKTDKKVTVALSGKDMKKAKKGKRIKVTYHEADGKFVAEKVKWLKKRKRVEGC